MIDKGFSILASIVVLATVTVLVASKNNTAGVSKSFWDGFSGSIRAAEGN